MEEIEEMILNGILDEETGEYIDEDISLNGGCGYPRKSKKNNISPTDKYLEATTQIRKIRKELALLIKKKHKKCLTIKEKNKATGDARAEINKKYGKGWRKMHII